MVKKIGILTQPSVSIELVSPALAERYLATNTRNRNLRPAHVAVLARAIQTHHWYLTSNGIGFDTDSVLIDGQNRLTAIIKAGVHGKAWVRRSPTGDWCAVRPGSSLTSPAKAATREGAARRLYHQRA